MQSPGSSLAVPSVQELVRENPMLIPDRYMRNYGDDELDAAHPPDLSSQIPLVDLPLISSGDPAEAKKLDVACREWGFFQVVNHGVDDQLLLKIKAAAKEFFELPLEEKMKCQLRVDEHVQGYGQAYAGVEDEKLDWSDMLLLMVYPQRFRENMHWPTSPPEFIEAIEEFSAEANRVAREVLSGVSLLMGMEKNGLLELHEGVTQAFRVNYYPPCSRPHQVLGISPHSDTGSLTLLLQDDNTAGLQIRHAGRWLPVDPIPNALVVNVGDALEIWSNGNYKSIEHRAVTNSARARISFVSFILPNEDAEVEPIESMVAAGEGRRKMYRSVRFGDYLKNMWKRAHAGKSRQLQSVKVQQLEPDAIN